MNLYWADFHKHVESLEGLETELADARGYVDCFPALLYPYRFEPLGRIIQETQQPQPRDVQLWRRMQPMVRDADQPGRFVTLMAMEWHGCRSLYGDLNVFYFDDHPAELVFPRSIEELYQHLDQFGALAIPHHTAYALGGGGTDWTRIDERYVPVADLFSNHGSSEGEMFGTLWRNQPMGPNVSGGSAIDALQRGLHLGLIASNDYAGLPGAWGGGLAGIWAERLDRPSIAQALRQRRVYGVTGDRIRLHFSANGQPMGSVLPGKTDHLAFHAEVIAAHAIDRVELVRNGVIVRTYVHNGRWEEAQLPERFNAKCRFHFSGGPLRGYGFQPRTRIWNAHMRLHGGALISVEPCFNCLGNRLRGHDSADCQWTMTTLPSPLGDWQPNPHNEQAIIFEIQATRDTRVEMEVDGRQLTWRVEELLQRSQLVRLLDEAEHYIQEHGGVDPQQIDNPDVYHHNARKIKADLAIPQPGYTAQVTFEDQPPRGRESWYYLRVTQRNGQMAWSSPIWADA